VLRTATMPWVSSPMALGRRGNRLPRGFHKVDRLEPATV
jgi:hypothetical protein